jgi:chromosome segregation ATPase
LSKELEEARTVLENNSDRFNRESKALNARVEAKIEKNVKLSETVTNLRDKCFGFATQCIARLKGIFNSIEAVSEEVKPSAEDIPRALEYIENEVDILDKVITGHSDFCALVASRGMVVAFMKAGCNHVRDVNKPNFSLS